MDVIKPSAEDGGKGTDFVAFVNGLVDVRKEGFDSFSKGGSSVHCHWGRGGFEHSTMQCKNTVVGWRAYAWLGLRLCVHQLTRSDICHRH